MAKLRKMLGKIDGPEVVAMMRLIETQSGKTLAAFAASFAETRYLPVCRDDRLAAAVTACGEYLAGDRSLKELKPFLKAAALAAREETDPVIQAASRAVAVACAVAQTPTNALGFLFYGAAATAYHTLGLDKTQAEYEDAAAAEFTLAYGALEAIAVPQEPSPAKINWGC